MASSMPQMSEAQLQQNVIDMAHVFGWLVHAERPAMRADGTWRTPIQGDKGFPDLVLAKADRQPLFLELKSQNGKVSQDQIDWALALAPLGRNASYWVLRPSDWFDGTIERVLKGETN
jgi:hypothetical protein